MTTIYQPFIQYTTDGTQRQFTFGFPYLSRAHIGVTRNGGAPALFKFIDDHTVDVHTLFGEPIPAGEPLKIFRATPDIDAYAEFKSASLMTADDLNRARLQVLYLIQERSGGIAGSVGSAVQFLTNELETVSGALDSIQYSQGLLTAGLQTLGALGERMESVADAQAALQQLIDDTVAGLDATTQQLVQRVDAVSLRQGNLESAVTSQITTLIGNDMAFAARVNTVEAKIDAIDLSGDDGDSEDTDIIAASVIMSAVAEAKSHYSQAKSIEQLKAQFGDAEALIQEERTVRASADGVLAQQITALQTEIEGNLAQVLEDIRSDIEVVDGKVTTVSANYTLKTMAQRSDGRQVMAGIGLNATASDAYTGSEIVLAAQRLLFVDTGSPNGELKPMFTAGSVDGSPTFIIPSNVMGDRAYPGRLLVDGSIEGRSVAANTITGDKIVAGSITTREIDVNLGVNLLPAAQFVEGLNYWTSGGNIAGLVFAVNGAGDSWHPSASNAATISQPNANLAGGSVDTYYGELVSTPLTVVPGERYEFSAYTGAHRCTVRLILGFLNASGSLIAATQADEDNAGAAQGGQTLAGYKRLSGFFTAPAQAASARLFLRKGPTTSGNTDSWLMAAMPFVAVAKPNQTRPSPWGPSGLGTRVTPEGITTPHLSALSSKLGTIDTGQVTINSDGAGGWGFVRSTNKWYRDGVSGWALGKHADGTAILSFETPTTKLWMHSNGDAGWQSPGISMTNGGLTINQLDVIDTLNIKGQAVTVPGYAEASDNPVGQGSGYFGPITLFNHNGGGSGAVFIMCCSGLGGSAFVAQVRLTRSDGVKIYEGICPGSMTLYAGTPSGNCNYTLEFTGTDFGLNYTLGRRSLLILATRR